jgi:hypothetical protein
MSSGFGLEGKVSRCFYDFQEFQKCLVSGLYFERSCTFVGFVNEELNSFVLENF